MNVMRGQVQSYITTTLLVKNISGKDIRAFNGTLTFKDLLGKDIMSISYTFDRGVEADAELMHETSIEYNQFLPDHVALLGKEVDQLTIDFEAEKILFEDGSVL